MMTIFPLAQKQFRYVDLNSIDPPVKLSPNQILVQRLLFNNVKLEDAEQNNPHGTETSKSKNEINSETSEPRSKSWEYMHNKEFWKS